jgi:hypothetical protein
MKIVKNHAHEMRMRVILRENSLILWGFAGSRDASRRPKHSVELQLIFGYDQLEP